MPTGSVAQATRLTAHIETINFFISFQTRLTDYSVQSKLNMFQPTAYQHTSTQEHNLAIIGARFTYVVTEWDKFKDKTFFDMINIRSGGIAIYGAIIFGLITVLIYNKVKKRSSLAMLDALAPAVLVGQIIGRWGNFVNAEAYGWTEGVENLPWRMELEKVYIDGIYQPDITCVHPTFIYESLWNAIGLGLIMFFLYRKKKFNGEIVFAYMGWYGLGRAYIETMRADSLYIIGELKFSVFVGVVCVIAAIIGEIALYKRYKTEKLEMAEYKSSFEAVKTALANESDSLDQSVFEGETVDEEDFEEEIDEEDAEVLAEQDMLDGEIDESEPEDEETPEEE